MSSQRRNQKNRRRVAAWTAALLTAVVAHVAAPSAHAFRVMGPVSKQAVAISMIRVSPHQQPPFIHWDLRNFPGCQIPFSYKSGTVDVPLADEFAEIDKAFATWAAGPGLISFRRMPLLADANCPFKLDDHNVLSWSAAACNSFGDDDWLAGEGPACGAGGAADRRIIHSGEDQWLSTSPNNCLGGGDDEVEVDPLTGESWITAGDNGIAETRPNSLPANVIARAGVFFIPSTGVIIDADILFNAQYIWQVIADSTSLGGNPDVQSIALHEIGHMIGIHHSEVPSAVMAAGVNLNADSSQHDLTIDDQDALAFLYTPDAGDAPWQYNGNQKFPSLVHGANANDPLNGMATTVHGEGAQHIFGTKTDSLRYAYEWLSWPAGRFPATFMGVDGECESQQIDADGDDGISFVPDPPIWGRDVQITAWSRYQRDAAGNPHDYGANPLSLNVWLDSDQNGDWVDAERIMHEQMNPTVPASGVGTTPRSTTVALPETPPDRTKAMWLRARLDYGEDATASSIGDLHKTRGAAQFGEVEDWSLKCTNRDFGMVTPNQTGQPRDGVALITAGDAPSAFTYGADADPIGCPIRDVFPFTVYDFVTDETIVEFADGVPVFPNEFRFSSRTHFDPFEPALTVLRAHWIPAAGPVTQADWIPTTNTEAVIRTYPPDFRVQVKVGAVNAGVGGYLSGRDAATGTWNDRMVVDVSYALTDFPMPPDFLSECDPFLVWNPAGGDTITPEDPFRFELVHPHQILVNQHNLILKVQSSWNLNGNTNTEYIQYPALFQTVSSPERPAPVRSLSLAASPNPVRDHATIDYALPAAAKVSLQVLDVQGRVVRTLEHGAVRTAGRHRAAWDGRDDGGRTLGAGVYFYRLEAGERTLSRKVTVIR